MAWIKTGSKYLIFVCAFTLVLSRSLGLDCGYPGSPAFGRPVPVRDSYRPGQSVTYSCAHGYTLKGSHQKTCVTNGTWTGIIPLCDQSLPGIDHHASSRATYRQQQFGADKAIDGNRDTCTYTDPAKPRWIRIDLQNNHLVEAVAVTVPKNMYSTETAHFIIYVISVQNSTTYPFTNAATYHKCSEFHGKFTTTTVKLSCATGGFYGKYIHIEDQRTNVAYFAICEINVFTQKDSYECGEPDRPSNSYTSNPEAGVVEYRCVFGYQLEGHVRRRCLANGQWSGTQPLCLEIVCPPLPLVLNGVIQYSGPVRGKPVQGTTANATCDYGYRPSGLAVQCLETGLWTEGNLECQPVDCHVPVVRNVQERYILLNRSTTYGSMAFLYCGDVQPEEGETPTSIRICREDGVWTESVVDCATSDSLETLGLVEDDVNTVPNGVIIGMAVVVFVLLLILIFILLFRRKQLSRRQSSESLPSKDTSSSITVSDVKNGLPYENDAFYASITVDTPKHQMPKDTKSNSQKSDQHPVVERGILSTILFAKRKACNNEKQTAPRIESTSSNSSMCFYEEIGVRSSGKKSKNLPRKVDDKENDCCTQPVYAQVDLDEKRKCRLAKSSIEDSDITTCHKPTDTSGNISRGYYADEAPTYDSELDSESVMLRELPPIPDDDDQSSGTYASLSQPPEPPLSLTSVFMRDNAIYGAADTTFKKEKPHIMKDNDVYSTHKFAT